MLSLVVRLRLLNVDCIYAFYCFYEQINDDDDDDDDSSLFPQQTGTETITLLLYASGRCALSHLYKPGFHYPS